MGHANRIIGKTEFPVADEKGARRGRQHSGHDLDQRRLAGPVVADQADDLVLADREVDIAQRLDRAKELLHALEANDILEVPLGDLDAGRLVQPSTSPVPKTSPAPLKIV